MVTKEMSRDHVLELMGMSANIFEWHANEDLVKKAHGGKLPEYWNEIVLYSGFAERIARKWPIGGQKPLRAA